MARERKFLAPNPGKDKLLIRRAAKEVPHSETITDALSDMKGGEIRAGFLRGGNLLRKPDYKPMPDGIIELKHKRVIQTVLLGIIEPNPLSAKSTVEMDRRSLVNKLNKSSLHDLKRLLPMRLRALAAEELEIVEITEEEKAEIQDLYKDVSP